MHVLVIEDEERLAHNLAKAISKNAGFAVDVALDGEDGLHLATSGVFDAIILDLMLPGKPGQEVLAALRKTGDKTPVLVLTAKEEKASIIRLLDSGADDYLPKPFDLGELLDKQGIAVRTGHHCAQPVMDRYCIPGTVRASMAVYTSGEDIDRLAAGIRKAAKMLG